MPNELWFDVYGRFLLRCRRGQDGWWRVHRWQAEGRLQQIDDVVIPADASNSEIRNTIEATYHELACAGTQVRRVSSPSSA